MITSKRAPGYTALVGSDLTPVTATIPTGATGLSAGVDLGNETLVGYVMPAAWTTASLTFQVSLDGVTYTDLYETTGTEVSHAVSTGRFVRVNPADWVGMRFIKVRSGTVGTPVNQVASRDIILVSRSV